MSYQKILVALDSSANSDAVFNQAVTIAKANNATLMLFHCLPIESRGVGSFSDIYGHNITNFSRVINERLTKETEEVKTWLNDYSQQAKAEGVTTELNWKVGDPGSLIRDMAKAWGANLVIVGRRGRRGIAEILLGSVSNYVVHHVPCSVLVVQKQK